MKKNYFYFVVIVVIICTVLPGCQLIGDIFKAGVWSGIIIVVLIIALILYLINRGKK